MFPIQNETKNVRLMRLPTAHYNGKISSKKMEGTLILKLPTVKSCQKALSKNMIRSRKKQKDQVTPKLQMSMVPFSSYQSLFLKPPLVWQPDSELKKTFQNGLALLCTSKQAAAQ